MDSAPRPADLEAIRQAQVKALLEARAKYEATPAHALATDAGAGVLISPFGVAPAAGIRSQAAAAQPPVAQAAPAHVQEGSSAPSWIVLALGGVALFVWLRRLWD